MLFEINSTKIAILIQLAANGFLSWYCAERKSKVSL